MCAQRRLRSDKASAQSDQSSLCVQWIAKDPRLLHADRKDSSIGAQVILLVLSCSGSFDLLEQLVQSRLIDTLVSSSVLVSDTARIASSKTVFSPFWVRAEHSRYFVALMYFAMASP